MVGWMGVAATTFRITKGQPREWTSNGRARRYFCATCGTGLYYVNEALIPGIVDVLIGILDDAAAVAPEIQVQLAERLPWVADLDRLPAFDRYPG